MCREFVGKDHAEVLIDINPSEKALKKDVNQLCINIIKSFSVDNITRTKVKSVQ